MPAATGAATGATGVTVTGVQGQVPHRRLLRLKPHSPAATSQRSSSEEMRAFSAACHTMPKKKAVVSGAGTGAAPAPDCSKLGRLLRHPESVLSSANKAKMAVCTQKKLTISWCGKNTMFISPSWAVCKPFFNSLSHPFFVDNLLVQLLHKQFCTVQSVVFTFLLYFFGTPSREGFVFQANFFVTYFCHSFHES